MTDKAQANEETILAKQLFDFYKASSEKRARPCLSWEALDQKTKQVWIEAAANFAKNIMKS